jgi:hypothetical protein
MLLKHGLVVASLVAVSLSAFAKDITTNGLSQSDFRGLSEDLGAALSYKPLTPTAPLGITGFDMGLAATATKIKNSDAFRNAGAGDVSTVVVPSLRFNKGLPLDLDVGVMVGEVPGTNVRLWGGELRYAIVSGGATMPAIGIRGSYTKLTGLSHVHSLRRNRQGVGLEHATGHPLYDSVERILLAEQGVRRSQSQLWRGESRIRGRPNRRCDQLRREARVSVLKDGEVNGPC